MAGNMKFHKLTLLLLWIYCLGFLLTPVQPAAAPVPVSEEWVRYYGFSSGVDAAMAVTTDRLGYVYVTGGSYDPDRAAMAYATVKYSPAGEEQWVARHYSRVGNYALPEAIDVDDSGNVYVTGTVTNGFLKYFVTVVYGHDGQELNVLGEYPPQFHFPYGTNELDKTAAQAVDDSGKVYVTGTMHGVIGYGSGGRIVTIKWGGTAGDAPYWMQIYGTASEDYTAFAMALDNDGNVLVTGVNRGTGEYITIKYDNQGQLIREWTYAAGPIGNPVAIAVDGDDNIYVFGSAMDGIQGRYCTLKYDSDGHQIWVQRHDPGARNVVNPMDMKVDAAGNVYATGSADSPSRAAEFYTVKYNTDGVLQWTTRYAGPGQAPNYAMRLGLDRFANVYVTGTWGDFYSGSSAIATVSYDSAGVLRWEAMEGRTGRPISIRPSIPPKEKGRVSRGRVYASGLAVGPGDNVVVAGNTWDEVIGPGEFLTIKYHQGIRRR